MNQHQESDEQASWDTNPLADYPVGPDDAGNAVMHGVGYIVSAWRWVMGKVTRQG